MRSRQDGNFNGILSMNSLSTNQFMNEEQKRLFSPASSNTMTHPGFRINSAYPGGGNNRRDIMRERRRGNGTNEAQIYKSEEMSPGREPDP